MPRVSFAKKIPKKIHFIWMGGKITAEGIGNIKSFAASNQDYEINIWTDKPMNILKSEAFLDSGKFKYRLRNIFHIQIKVKQLHGYLLREMHGVYKNLPAASDILRLLILYLEGGVYFDIDVRTGGIHEFTDHKELKPIPLGDIYAPYGFLLNFWYNSKTNIYATPTHIIASVKNANFLAKYLLLLSDNVIDAKPDILWVSKRKFPAKGQDAKASDRYLLTLETTGPTFIQQNYLKILLEELARLPSTWGELQKIIPGIKQDQKSFFCEKESSLFPILSFPVDGLMNVGLVPKASGAWATFFGKCKLRPCEYEDILYSNEWKMDRPK